MCVIKNTAWANQSNKSITWENVYDFTIADKCIRNIILILYAAFGILCREKTFVMQVL